MDILGSLSAENLAHTLRTRLESSLYSGKTNCEFSLSSVLAIEEDLTKALFAVRSIRNTFAPINKLHPELLAAITTSIDDPFGEAADCTDLQFFCAAVCRYWRNSLLAFSKIWSSVDTTNVRHMKLYLTRSKEAPLHVQYGWVTRPGVFERHIMPERQRLQSLSIALGDSSPGWVLNPSVDPSKSLRTLNMWMAHEEFSVPAGIMKAISRFAPNLTVLKLHEITTSLSSLEFPALIKLTFCLTVHVYPNLVASDLVNFLKHSPDLEILDLRLPDNFEASPSAGTVELLRLKSAVLNGSLFEQNKSVLFNGRPSLMRNKSVRVNGLPCLVFPNRSITIDVQITTRPHPSDGPPLLPVIHLGDTIFPRQSIRGAVFHFKDDPGGFFGHVGICGEHDNWIGLNYVQTPDLGEDFVYRFRTWFNPICSARLRGIQMLTLGLFEFGSDEEQCIEVLRTFLQELYQVRVLNVYGMGLSLLARILHPSNVVIPLPSLEELKLHTYNPPELTRCAAHGEVHPGPSKRTRPLRASWHPWEHFKCMGHDLQEALLCKEPMQEKAFVCEAILQRLEKYEGIASNLLSYSGIGEVLRRLSSRQDTLNHRFQERAGLLIKRWSWQLGGYVEGSGCDWLSDVDANSHLLYDMLRAREKCTGRITSVTVESGSGRTTSVTAPYS